MPSEQKRVMAGIYPYYKELLGAIEVLKFNDHLCLIYETPEEQFAAIVPFMRIGLERGEKCVYIADENTCDQVIEQLAKGGVDTKATLASGALSVITKREAYLKQGYFDPDWMISFLKQATDRAKAEGYTGLRATGEMTWMLGGDPGTERLIEYESKLNYFFPKNDVLAICQYHIGRFTPEIIMGIIKTHPLVIYRGQVCRNFYYVPPDDMMLPDQGYLEVSRLLYNIVERERLENLSMEAEGNLARMEEEVEEAERISKTGNWDWDAGTGKISWSDGAYRIFGIDPGMPTPEYAEHIKLYAPESARKLEAAVEKALKTGEPYELDLELAPGIGQGRWVMARGQARRDQNGRVTGLSGSVVEITGRKHAELALQESEERFRSFSENIDTVFWMISLDPERFQYINSAFERIWGKKAEELYINPRTWLESIHPEDRAVVKNHFEQWISGGKDEYRVEYRVIRPEGDTRWVEARGIRLGNKKIAGIAQDITARKLAEEEQIRKNKELELLLGKVKTLSGLLPICAYCKKIRNDSGYWESLEKYLREHSEAEFTHCICPECAEKFSMKDTGTG